MRLFLLHFNILFNKSIFLLPTFEYGFIKLFYRLVYIIPTLRFDILVLCQIRTTKGRTIKDIISAIRSKRLRFSAYFVVINYKTVKLNQLKVIFTLYVVFTWTSTTMSNHKICCLSKIITAGVKSIMICSVLRYYNPLPFHEFDLPNQTIYRICYQISKTTGATCGAGSAYPSGAHEITPSF